MGTLSAIRDGLKTRLLTISGLRAHDTIPNSITPPCAVVGAPEPTSYDLVARSPKCRHTIPVRVYASKASERTGQDSLDGYIAASGATSVKEAIEADVTLGGAADTVRVIEARGYGVYNISGVDYLGVEFAVEVIG